MKGSAALMLVAMLATTVMAADGPVLNLPSRAPDALSGSEIAAAVSSLSLREREDRLFAEVASGNIPNFLRTFKAVPFTNDLGAAVVYVAPDYLAVGCDTNFLRVPLTPMTAQGLADLTGCTLPTVELVDAIWRAANTRLAPQPLPPDATMTEVNAFVRHQARVQLQLKDRTHSGLIAGHKKDVVMAGVLTNRVAIYGWHQLDGRPIQPLYRKHLATWVDYSHGVRLISRQAQLNGRPVGIEKLLSAASAYATNWPGDVLQHSVSATNQADATFVALGFGGEREATFNVEPAVRVRINLPAPTPSATNTVLVLYALPNGNTIEQTAGRIPAGTNEWRYDIQHIAAQMRFVRTAQPETRLVLAYVEAGGLSWPAWRKRHGDEVIPRIVDHIRTVAGVDDCDLVLAGHSGGGSFIFGYVNAVGTLPQKLQRLVFLDANYGFTPAHSEPLLQWLNDSATHRLMVFAYDDAAARLDGKPFVSKEGGTWGRSAAMLQELGRQLHFNSTTNGPLQHHQALNGRVEFLLRENPERKIWHTVMVERNGLVHGLLSGTPQEGNQYQYLGPRAYQSLIQPRHAHAPETPTPIR